MGRSPGKWIKTVLFGKKATRSHSSSKARDAAKAGNDGDYLGGKGPPALAVNSPVISEPVVTGSDRCGILRETEKGMPSNVVNDEQFVISAHQDSDKLGLPGSTMPNDPERLREEQAAVKVQAAVRGYLARRAFLTLKGIIRLQALVRGHLVRRQAVATLRAVQALVKLQALVRGWKIRHSGFGFEANGNLCKEKLGNAKPVGTWEEELLANVFVSRLLPSLPAALPLQIQYREGEPNSALIWMERWTSYGIWKPVPPAKKTVDLKPQTKRTNYAMETESGRPKRISKRTSSTSVEHGLNNSCSEPEKPKRNPKKNSSSAVDSVLEHPQSELEKVKRNLRKVSNLTAEASERADLETEKPTHSLRKVSSTPEILEQVVEESTEKPKKDVSPVPETKLDIEVATQKCLPAEEPQDVLIDSSPAVAVSQWDDSINDSISAMNGHMSSTGEHTCNENQKTSKRRSSFSTKSEYAENGSPNTSTLPSYMAATESAKAKLRSQNSPRLCSDLADKNGFTRRHSLPSSTNGKPNSHSPRTPKLVQAGGVKGGFRSDRSLLSSREANERPIQVEWRR